MNKACKSVPIIFRNLHGVAEQIERAAFSQLCWVRVDPKRAEVYAEEYQKHWNEIVEWKRTVDEQMQRVKEGKEIENCRLYMS